MDKVVKRSIGMSAVIIIGFAAAMEVPEDCHTLAGALEIGNMAQARVLLEKGANPNIPGISPHKNSLLLWALESQKKEAIDLLLEYRADYTIKTEKQSTSLLLAAYYGYTDFALRFIKSGIDPCVTNVRGESALYWAAHNRQVPLIRMLIINGSDPNEVVPSLPPGKTLLMELAQQGIEESIQALLIGGADPHKIDGEGNTALTYAAYANNKECIKTLLVYGVQCSSKNCPCFPLTFKKFNKSEHHHTALIIAAREGKKDAVQALLQGVHCSNIKKILDTLWYQKENYLSLLPIHLNPLIVDYFRKGPASSTFKNKKGKTALENALLAQKNALVTKQKDYEDIIAMLKSRANSKNNKLLLFKNNLLYDPAKG